MVILDGYYEVTQKGIPALYLVNPAPPAEPAGLLTVPPNS